MFKEKKCISLNDSKSKFVYLSIFLLINIGACSNGGSDGGTTQSMPKEIQDVDDVLAKPYNEHFKNMQGDYAVANQIAGKIQLVIDNAHSLSAPYIMGLVQEASDLVKSPTADHYASLKEEWNRVRSKIRLRNK